MLNRFIFPSFLTITLVSAAGSCYAMHNGEGNSALADDEIRSGLSTLSRALSDALPEEEGGGAAGQDQRDVIPAAAVSSSLPPSNPIADKERLLSAAIIEGPLKPMVRLRPLMSHVRGRITRGV